jgi:cytidylate kinase
VRDALKTAQQQLGSHTSLVAEGRDMGTVVFPAARYKFFLDARPEVRGKRRYDELIAKGKEADLELITAQIKERDHQDRNRAIAPLKPADDAMIVDTSDLDIAGVLDIIVKAVRK